MMIVQIIIHTAFNLIKQTEDKGDVFSNRRINRHRRHVVNRSLLLFVSTYAQILRMTTKCSNNRTLAR
uniref:Uncharacterized protein n=1 Tax=Romanomermis culicivorax TaxID=13658 RepID=A0A915IK59_ROMCU